MNNLDKIVKKSMQTAQGKDLFYKSMIPDIKTYLIDNLSDFKIATVENLDMKNVKIFSHELSVDIHNLTVESFSAQLDLVKNSLLSQLKNEDISNYVFVIDSNPKDNIMSLEVGCIFQVTGFGVKHV